jgi:integrase
VTTLADDILNTIAEIEQKQSSAYIDVKVLATALKIAYLTGLTRREIISLQVKDALQANGQIVSEIKSCERVVQGNVRKLILSDEVKVILREYLAYLKEQKYPLNRNANLFPQRTPKHLGEYDETKIDRDVNEISGGLLTFRSVRHAGIRRVFNSQDTYDRELKYERAAEYARTGKRNIKNMFGEYRRTTRRDLEDEDGYDYFKNIRPGYGSDQDDDLD